MIVTLGTLLLQGTSLRTLAVRLDFDVETERREAEAAERRGRELLAEAVDHDGPLTAADYDKQRAAAGFAIQSEQLDEAIMRELVEDVDLRQSAAEREKR